MQQTIVQSRRFNLNPIRQNESALELPCRYAAMQENTVIRFRRLASADDQLVVLDLHAEVSFGKAGNRERDPEPPLVDLLHVVGRVAIPRALVHPVESAFQLVEAQQ